MATCDDYSSSLFECDLIPNAYGSIYRKLCIPILVAYYTGHASNICEQCLFAVVFLVVHRSVSQTFQRASGLLSQELLVIEVRNFLKISSISFLLSVHGKINCFTSPLYFSGNTNFFTTIRVVAMSFQ